MCHERRLKLIIIGGILLCTFLFIAKSLKAKNCEDDDTKLPKEQATQRCPISICTPCQYLDPDEQSKFLETFHSGAFHFIQYGTFPPLKTTQLEDLPASGVDRIEKILHQKWNTNMIPIQFRNYSKSFIDNHPSWQYMFWTDQSTRRFIHNQYPRLLSLYDNYANPLNRADSLRYMILFYYGGVYSDIDIESLRPLDPMIKKYSCFLSQEPHVHSIVYTNFYEQASTALMACRKRHPFMKSIIENLYTFFYFANEQDSTGPRFLTYLFRKYSRKKGKMEMTDDDFVYLAPPEYFNPTVDPGMDNLLTLQCGGVYCLSAVRKWQCDQWRQEGVILEPYTFSFTKHVWAHIAYQEIQSLAYIDISEICSTVSFYE